MLMEIGPVNQKVLNNKKNYLFLMSFFGLNLDYVDFSF
jgi:hypothetical protein